MDRSVHNVANCNASHISLFVSACVSLPQSSSARTRALMWLSCSAPVVGCGQRVRSLVWVDFSQLLVNVFFWKSYSTFGATIIGTKPLRSCRRVCAFTHSGLQKCCAISFLISFGPNSDWSKCCKSIKRNYDGRQTGHFLWSCWFCSDCKIYK